MGEDMGEGTGDGRWAWGPELRGLLSLQIPPSFGSSPQTSGTRYAGWFLALLGPGSVPLGEVMGPNMGGQAVCAFLHSQEAMQMVPKFCFPFDVERYGRKQTSKDLGTQGLRQLETQGIRDPNNEGPIYPGAPDWWTVLGALLGEVRELGPTRSLRAFSTSRKPPSPAVQHFTFALTDLTGTRRFGFCRLRAGAHSCLCILRCGI